MSMRGTGACGIHVNGSEIRLNLWEAENCIQHDEHNSDIRKNCPTNGRRDACGPIRAADEDAHLVHANSWLLEDQLDGANTRLAGNGWRTHERCLKIIARSRVKCTSVREISKRNDTIIRIPGILNLSLCKLGHPGFQYYVRTIVHNSVDIFTKWWSKLPAITQVLWLGFGTREWYFQKDAELTIVIAKYAISFSNGSQQ